MASTTAAGTKIGISAALPATENAAGYAALTYTRIGGAEQLGTIGAATAVVSFQPLDGPEEKHKGPTNYGSFTPAIAHNIDDAGQSLLRTAADPDNNALYSIKIELKTGEILYTQVRCFGYPRNIGAAGSIVMVNPVMEANTKIVTVEAP